MSGGGGRSLKGLSPQPVGADALWEDDLRIGLNLGRTPRWCRRELLGVEKTPHAFGGQDFVLCEQ